MSSAELKDASRSSCPPFRASALDTSLLRITSQSKSPHMIAQSRRLFVQSSFWSMSSFCRAPIYPPDSDQTHHLLRSFLSLKSAPSPEFSDLYVSPYAQSWWPGTVEAPREYLWVKHKWSQVLNGKEAPKGGDICVHGWLINFAVQ